MTHTPELLHVIEQNERDKDARCVRLVDSNGVFALVIDEKYGERIAALWNMAERLGLSTEEIESGDVETKLKAATDMLEALVDALVDALVEVKMRIEEYTTTCPLCGESAERGHKYYCLWHVANDAIRKARDE